MTIDANERDEIYVITDPQTMELGSGVDFTGTFNDQIMSYGSDSTLRKKIFVPGPADVRVVEKVIYDLQLNDGRFKSPFWPNPYGGQGLSFPLVGLKGQFDPLRWRLEKPCCG